MSPRAGECRGHRSYVVKGRTRVRTLHEHLFQVQQKLRQRLERVEAEICTVGTYALAP